MPETRISIKRLEWKAFRKRLDELHLIIVSVSIIIVTAVLVYFFPKIECNKRLLFLISSIWPSGVLVVLVPMWTAFVRDITENMGYYIYKLLKEEVSQKFDGSSQESYFLRLIENCREKIQSAEKATRREALKGLVEEINNGHQGQ